SMLCAAADATIRIWDTAFGRQVAILEGHTAAITGVSLSAEGQLLASRSLDGTMRLWRTDTWETVAVLPAGISERDSVIPAFHPRLPILAGLGEQTAELHIWELDLQLLLSISASAPVAHYTNAKVVLLGDSGVGKSGLALVLSEQPFASTDSTHGLRIW